MVVAATAAARGIVQVQYPRAGANVPAHGLNINNVKHLGVRGECEWQAADKSLC